MAQLQPVTVRTVLTRNPTMDYNVYLSTTLIPNCLCIFFFIVTTYCLGTELKFHKGRELMLRANGNILTAVLGKIIPLIGIFLIDMLIYLVFVYGYMGFPHACSSGLILLNGLLLVLAGVAFGVFIFGLLPSLRMSMSVCALWSVLSFSICGFTFPVEAMDAPIRMLSWLFPMRHYFMIYQSAVLNGNPISYVWIHYVCLFAFILLPVTVLPQLKRVFLTHTYIP